MYLHAATTQFKEVIGINGSTDRPNQIAPRLTNPRSQGDITPGARGYKENSPGCEGDVADEETGLRRRPTVPTPGSASASASAAPTPAVAVAGVVVALAPRRAPAVSPPRAIAPARTPAAVASHRSSRMLRRP